MTVVPEFSEISEMIAVLASQCVEIAQSRLTSIGVTAPKHLEVTL
jgi:hypothetical protein